MRAKASQKRPRLDHVGAKMATLCSTWLLLDGLWVDLDSILEAFWHMGQIEKNIKKPKVLNVFLLFWGGWGGLLRRLKHCFELCWLQDRILVVILGKFSTCWRQDGDQERQDEPT